MIVENQNKQSRADEIMDLEDDWEYLPDAPINLLPDHNDGLASMRPASESVFNMDYFSSSPLLPPPPKPLISGPQFVPLQFPSPTLQVQDLVHDAASQDFFKNNEFVDTTFLKSSPLSNHAASDFMFDEITTTPTISPSSRRFDGDEIDRNLTFGPHQPGAKNDVSWIGEGIIGDDYYAIDEDDGFNFPKLGFGGIGAFGIAAAAICVIIFGNNYKGKEDLKLRFQICATEDLRIKQAVPQATLFDEAMSAAVLIRANITYGGYYDNSLSKFQNS